jgi:hypothetical protein
VKRAKDEPARKPAVPVKRAKDEPARKPAVPVKRAQPARKPAVPVKRVPKDEPARKPAVPVRRDKDEPARKPAVPVKRAKDEPARKPAVPVKRAKDEPARKPAVPVKRATKTSRLESRRSQWGAPKPAFALGSLFPGGCPVQQELGIGGQFLKILGLDQDLIDHPSRPVTETAWQALQAADARPECIFSTRKRRSIR